MRIQDDLKQLVSQSVKLLGQAFKEVHGTVLFNKIEGLRVKMKGVRGREAEIVESTLQSVYKSLHKSDDEELRQIAKSFSLMLELINTCEAAYRSHRLQNYKISLDKKPDALIYVFTSHPTESRSQSFLKLMAEIEVLLIQALNEGFDCIQEKLFYYLKIAVRLNLSNNRRPQVKDEMEQIFYNVLDPHILREQISLNRKGLSVQFRTWVGGDKDGHPKVGSSTMLESFNLSRSKIIDFINKGLKEFENDLELITVGDDLKVSIRALKDQLIQLRKVAPGDGKKVVALKKLIPEFRKKLEKIQLPTPFIEELEKLLWLYPALVLPLEIREDSELIHKALKESKQPIAGMLVTLKKVSQGMDSKWYVRGFVISMCQSTEDLLAAATLTRKKLGSYAIPVVPLFENEKGLTNSIEILKNAFSQFDFEKEHHKRWGGRFEVMVGYSDSSKENGVLPARLMLEDSLFKLEKFLKSKKFTPVFFHGSGGSTSRGGGSVQEQVSWWPQSALNIFKVTIQGEMVQRNFNNPLIMRSQAGKVVEGFATVKPKRQIHPPELNAFAARIQASYRELVHNSDFQELTSSATPYDYLNLLKMGSRPSKRAAKGKFSLRAIPWILCWTQTRLLLPVWWGTGSAWKELSKQEKNAIKEYYDNSPLMQSYVKNLGFTLAKIELGVWNFHLEQSRLPLEEKKKWKETITAELNLSIKFFQEISGHKSFTWSRPWLGESIYFRSSMIHPLNVIQKLALERGDHYLLRESVTGIACGMLTTG